jgi:photosystem II stability/assembly factor-like uncharacterized protein
VPAPVACPAPTPNAPILIDNLNMKSPTVGWAQESSAAGTILHTTAGVQEWTVASPPLSADQQVVAASFLDGQTAQAITGTLLSCPDLGPPSADLVAWGTDDGGVTWAQEGSFQVQQLVGGALDFVNPQDGWFSDPEGGWAGGSAMALYRTVDGGATWQEVASSFPDGTASPTSVGSIPLVYVGEAVFVSPSTGWIAGNGAGNGALLYVSHDGGDTWDPQPLPAAAGLLQPSTMGPEFWSSQGGWLLVAAPGGQVSLAFLTADGGQSWAPIDLPGAGEIPEIADFVDADDGWLLTCPRASCGEDTSETLWATRDGGASWAAVSADAEITSLDFVSADEGWATAAADGVELPTLLQTADGGATWTAVTPQVTGPPAAT